MQKREFTTAFAAGTDSNTNNAKDQNPPTMSEVRNAPVTSNQGATKRSSKTRNNKESSLKTTELRSVLFVIVLQNIHITFKDALLHYDFFTYFFNIYLRKFWRRGIRR